MNYRCSYNNSTFPYNHVNKKKYYKNVENDKKNIQSETKEKEIPNSRNRISSLFDKFISPVENAIGRKITFDDLLLIALIYLLYTEKENDNNLLLLTLIFLLFN